MANFYLTDTLIYGASGHSDSRALNLLVPSVDSFDIFSVFLLERRWSSQLIFTMNPLKWPLSIFLLKLLAYLIFCDWAKRKVSKNKDLEPGGFYSSWNRWFNWKQVIMNNFFVSSVSVKFTTVVDRPFFQSALMMIHRNQFGKIRNVSKTAKQYRSIDLI